MATSNLVNGPVTINDNNELSLYGVTGLVDGKYWIMNVAFGMRTQVDPAPASPSIEKCISRDYEAGNGEKIKYIQVSPNVGVRLYLEGRITRAMLKDADVGIEGTVVCKQVVFGTPAGAKIYNVNIVENSEFEFATIDASGKVV